VIAIVGASRFLRGLALNEVLGGLRDELDALGPTRFDGSTAVLAEVLDEVRMPSLLGGRRVAVVDDADDLISANRAPLERYVSDPAPAGTLVFLCDSMPKTTRLYKAIDAAGRIIFCEPPKGRAVMTWITERARTAYGKQVAPAAAAALREALGDEPGMLDAELAKLSSYVGDRSNITAADVAAVTGQLREEKVFAVTDAIASGDIALALSQWEQVLATDRAAPARSIAGLAWGVRRLLECKRDFEAGASIFELSRRLFVDADVARQRLQRVSAGQLERQLQDLLDADIAIKTGLSTIETVIEKFIVTHAIKPERASA